MKTWTLLTILLFIARFLTAADAGKAPFRLPASATVTHVEQDAAGWNQEGVIANSMPAARRLMISALTSSHWRMEKAIPIGSANERMLYRWAKGRQRMMLMMWRIDENKTGFSWGRE